MPIDGEYLGMRLAIHDVDEINLSYFEYCAKNEFRLQCCNECDLVRYPPTTACPFCAHSGSSWKPIEPVGEVHSYGEVHHAINPAFREHVPYMILLVELDTQKHTPGEHDALRVIANLVQPDGELAPPELIRQVGIGSRVRMVFRSAGEGIAIPLFCLDPDSTQPQKVWRYPQE